MTGRCVHTQSFLLKGKDYASFAEGAVICQVGDPWLMPEAAKPPIPGDSLCLRRLAGVAPEGRGKGEGQADGELHSHSILNAREQGSLDARNRSLAAASKACFVQPSKNLAVSTAVCCSRVGYS